MAQEKNCLAERILSAFGITLLNRHAPKVTKKSDTTNPSKDKCLSLFRRSVHVVVSNSFTSQQPPTAERTTSLFNTTPTADKRRQQRKSASYFNTMNIKGYNSVRSSQNSQSDADASGSAENEIDVMGLTRIKADSRSDSGTEYTASNEGIEVEAIEFDKANYGKKEAGCPKRLLLFISAFVVVLTASAAAGFAVLNSKKKSSSVVALTSDGPQLVNVAKNETDTSARDPTELIINIDGQDISISERNETSTTVIETLAPSDQGSSSVSSSGSFLTGGESLWADSLDEPIVVELPVSQETECPDHALAVSSSCAVGSASSILTASYCFASKHDGDWYWVRSAATNEDGTTAVYDSWDYTEEEEGQLTLLDLTGGSYTISLVRDSMDPYDEIISQTFTIPQCQ